RSDEQHPGRTCRPTGGLEDRSFWLLHPDRRCGYRSEPESPIGGRYFPVAIGGDGHPHSPRSFLASATAASGESPNTTARRRPLSSATKQSSRRRSPSHVARAPRAERHPAPVSASSSR